MLRAWPGVAWCDVAWCGPESSVVESYTPTSLNRSSDNERDADGDDGGDQGKDSKALKASCFHYSINNKVMAVL